MKRKKRAITDLEMKRKKATIIDLSFDVLRHIMYCVATSLDGASNIIVLSSVCRVFKELANESDILKAVKFHDVKLSGLHRSFWQQNGLLCRCMQNENQSALCFAMEYADSLDLIYKVHRRVLFQRMVILLARLRAVETVNTRSRRNALSVAEDDYKRVCDAADIDIKRGKEFIEMLQAVIK